MTHEKISDEKANELLGILEGKIIGKVREEDVPEECVVTNEQMAKGLQTALHFIDNANVCPGCGDHDCTSEECTSAMMQVDGFLQSKGELS